MNYELAKKLKESGFNTSSHEVVWEEDSGMGFAIVPTLSELIEACGDNFKHLHFHKERYKPIRGRWSVIGRNNEGKRITDNWGHAPEEAVANLWLKLNEK